MRVMIVIPARYGSSRFPGKPLSLIQNKPMIQWVYEGASQTLGVDEIVVATDDDRIVAAVEAFQGKVLLTSSELQSGTDRVAAVAREHYADIYVNVQGDEPLIQGEVIARPLEWVRQGRFPIATAMTSLKEEEKLNPNVVKVTSDPSGKAIRFSRTHFEGAKKHIGLYVYEREALFQFQSLSPTAQEMQERLEQLRAMEHGIPIGVVGVAYEQLGVDTPEDLEKVRRILV